MGRLEERSGVRVGVVAATALVVAVLAPAGAQAVHEEQPDALESRLVAFESNRDGDFDIFVMDPSNELGGAFTIHRLTDHISAQYEPTWSPDGLKIAYESEQDGDLEIWVMDADGGNKTQLTTNSASDIEPAWSPDGSMIAYASDIFGSPNAYDIVVMPVDDPAAIMRVTFDPALDMWPTWSPDGQHLAFKSMRDGNWEIYRVPLDDVFSPVNLTNDPASDQNPDWSPDGTRIAFDSDRAVNPNIWIMNADGSDPVWTSGLFGSDREPNWSPDGQQIAFTSNRGSGQDEIWILNPNGSLFATASGPALSYEIHQAPAWQPGADTDGDGLWDSWERYGLWDGDRFLDLPAMGADPLHKDIFVEIDYMDCDTPPVTDTALCTSDPDHNEHPEPWSISEVVHRFNVSGVSNPDGSTGIHLHVDYGAPAPLTWGEAATWGDLTEGGSIPHDSGAIVTWSASAWDWSPFDAFKATHFNPERHRVFHYNIWAHFMDDSSGISRNPDGEFFTGASDFAVTFNGLSTVARGFTAEQERKSHAGTFMHELGHNLGLGHGGDQEYDSGEHVNDKPNYLSVMNYLFQHDGVPWRQADDSWGGLIDYSHVALPDLDENALDEAKGIGVGSNQGTKFWCGLSARGCTLRRPGMGLRPYVDNPADKVDWDRSGIVITHPVTTRESDVNGDRALGVLHGYDDWEHLVFTGGLVGAGRAEDVVLPMTNSYDEMTVEEFLTTYAPPTVAERRSTAGLVDPTSGRWHLRNAAGDVTAFFYGNPGDVAFMGDWDCDGIDTPGLFRQSDAYAYLRNSNTQGIADIRFFFGNPSDVPLAGDWNGDGCDTLSIYRPSEQRFYIMNELGEDEGGLGAADFSFLFGNPGDKPVVGDWDRDGVTEVGLHRESTGFFYWRNTLDTGIASDEIFFGDPGDRFVAGDWGIVDGQDTPAVFRPAGSTFFFRHTLTQGNADSQFPLGESTWLPVAGSFGLG